MHSEKHIEEYRITNNGEHIETNHIELQLQITNTKVCAIIQLLLLLL